MGVSFIGEVVWHLEPGDSSRHPYAQAIYPETLTPLCTCLGLANQEVLRNCFTSEIYIREGREIKKGREKKHAVLRKTRGLRCSYSTVGAPSRKQNSIQMAPVKRLGFPFLLEDIRARKSVVPILTMKISQNTWQMHEFSLNSSEVTGKPSGQVFYRVSHHRQDVGASFPGAVATSPWEKKCSARGICEDQMCPAWRVCSPWRLQKLGASTFSKTFLHKPQQVLQKKKKSRTVLPCGRPGGGVEQLLREGVQISACYTQTLLT